MRVAHVIRTVNDGGASLGLLRMCVDGPAEVSPTVVSLLPPAARHVAPFEAAGVPVLTGPEAARAAAAEADLVQVEWWNNPYVNDFLVNADLPDCRILLHARGHFDAPGMCPSQQLLARVDGCTVTVPSAAANPRFQRNRALAGLPPARCVFSCAAPDERAALRQERPEGGPVVFGYLGTVEPIKMHSATLRIAAEVAQLAPDAVFAFAGDGTLEDYREQAARLGIADRVRFPGFQTDPAAFLAGLDVFYYPLNPYTYATSEKALQEAMLAGLPCVAFPSGGVRDLLVPGSALLATTPEECVDACLALAASARLRRVYGARARARIDVLPERRRWRAELAGARAQMLALPASPRTGLGVAPDDLFAFCTDPAGCPDDDPDPTRHADRARVAAFVTDDYDEWLDLEGPVRLG